MSKVTCDVSMSIDGFVAGVNNAWRAIRRYSKEAAGLGQGDDDGNRRLP